MLFVISLSKVMFPKNRRHQWLPLSKVSSIVRGKWGIVDEQINLLSISLRKPIASFGCSAFLMEANE